MNKFVLLVVAMAVLSACSTFTPPRYSVGADNVVALRKIAVGDIAVGSFSGPAEFDNACRGAGPIAPPDNATFAEYIRKAFADELKIAGVYDDDNSPRITISGAINSMDFSSTMGVTGGNWNIDMTVNSSNGQSMTMAEHYVFESGFAAITACDQTADAFMNAVQNLIGKIVSSPEFEELLV